MIDGVRFLGTSLWTDLCTVRISCRRGAICPERDERPSPHISGRRRRPLSPELHESSLAWRTASLQVPFAGKTVVVTHHLPHPGSIHPRFADDALAPAFCSDLSELVESSGAALWVHGHTHESCDYVAGGTRVVCNPKGYGPIRREGRYENTYFDPSLVVEI